MKQEEVELESVIPSSRWENRIRTREIRNEYPIYNKEFPMMMEKKHTSRLKPDSSQEEIFSMHSVFSVVILLVRFVCYCFLCVYAINSLNLLNRLDQDELVEF